MEKFIKQHPVLFYYAIVFGISWGGTIALIGGPGSIPGTKEQVGKLFVSALLIMFAGPFMSGILMNFLVNGKEGLRDLLSRLSRWQVDPRWYGIAIFAGPIFVAGVLLMLSLFNSEFLPGIVTAQDKVSLMLFGIAWGLIGGGVFEETGWTGFAVPELRHRYGILSTGLIVGSLWGIWHLLIALWATNFGNTDSWAIFMAGFLAFYLVALPAYRVLMVWVYDRTKSLPVIMLMHAFLSASCLIFQPSASQKTTFIWNLVLGAVFWVIVIVAVVLNPEDFSRKIDYQKINEIRT